MRLFFCFILANQSIAPRIVCRRKNKKATGGSLFVSWSMAVDLSKQDKSTYLGENNGLAKTKSQIFFTEKFNFTHHYGKMLSNLAYRDLAKMFSQRKNSGFTLIEMLIGLTMFSIITSIAIAFLNDINRQYQIDSGAELISKIPLAVQRRSAHDGFLYLPWDTNGNRAATGAAITWAPDKIQELLRNFLVGRKNASCGQVNGWNPLNNDGTKDGGTETEMERAELVSCTAFSASTPFNIKMSAVITPDSNSAIGSFVLYLDMASVNFGKYNDTENNVQNYSMLYHSLNSKLSDSINGISTVSFGLMNNLANTNDDTLLTHQQCDTRLANKQPCNIVIRTSFSGVTSGMLKRTDNLDSFVDDVTFKTSASSATRQQCAHWVKSGTTWTQERIVDCAIKAGSGDTSVSLVFDEAQAGEFIVTNKANVNYTCNIFGAANESGNNFALVSKGTSPCGLLKDGSVVQLVTDVVQAKRLYGKDLLSERVFSGHVSLYSSGSGAIMMQVFDAAHNTTVFQIDNNGNVTSSGKLSVGGAANFASTVTVNDTLIAGANVQLQMNNNSTVKIGNPDGNNGLELSRNQSTSEFNMAAKTNKFNLVSGNTGQGVKLDSNGATVEMKLSAQRGVIADNGTSMYASQSTLNGAVFNAAGGVNTTALKSRSQLVTADMAKYLDDTSSPFQFVGTENISGSFTVINKPDCFAFAKDSNFSSPQANPYRQMIDDGRLDINNGKAYARLILVPTFLKTYNSAFGDNQMYAQHAWHSTPDTWDVYLYLSGEGAFGTGAREDGAGGSLALLACDYSSVSFSRQAF